MPDDSTSTVPIRLANPEVADSRSAMTPRFNLFFRWFARRYFRHFDLDDQTVKRLRDLESRGSVFYVMRYASRLDYFLFNTLFAREGLRLSGFANGLSFYYYQPLLAALRVWGRRRRLSRKARSERDLERAKRKVRDIALAGESAFLFLRTARLARRLRGREAAIEQGRRELDLIGEIVDSVWTEHKPVYLVPLALFWRKGPRAERRFLNLSYGTPTRPSDFAKVSSFLVTYRGLSVKVGEEIDLRSFIDERGHEGRSSIVRKVRRSILLFLYREERIVEGPTLRARHKVQELVLGDPRVLRAIEERSRERKSSPEAARAAAEKIFREISANMNSTFLALLNAAVTFIFKRMFVSIEDTGLGKVADYAKRHPVVLVPSHRSYFDFLILSWLFYGNHMVPPHIAARENMAFGPFGFLFRRAGAFFLRRSFEDPLYKEVFRRYVGHLVREGFTQEFFIEGGRSRTGKSLAPRLGMLSWNIEAFVASGRRDLFFVPVSMLGLVRARKYLQHRFGSVFVNFGEPISLAQVLEGHRELFLSEESPELAAQKRALTEGLGNAIVERINWAMVANSTSVAASALLGEPRRGMFRSELTQRMREVVDLLRLQDVRMTPALVRDEPEFDDSIAFLLRAGLIQSEQDPRGEILYYDESRRRALDVYRNVLFHFLVAPSLLARRLQRGASSAALREDLRFWLDLLYREFFAPKAAVLGLQFEALLDYFERIGVVEHRDEQFRVTEKGQGYIAFLSEQTRSLIEAYYATFSAIHCVEEPSTAKQLEKAAEQQFARAHLLGEIQRTEGWNLVTFRNALDLLTERGILESVAGEKERERSYRRGAAFEELAGLRERLAAVVSAR
jgi:glycerol-3-phosphate O-acyltransferase